MAFLGGLFKRKPGGTFFGNLIRGAVKSVPVVGGVLGNGTMMISQDEYDLKNLSDADYNQKYGKTKSGQLLNITPNPTIQTPEQRINDMNKAQMSGTFVATTKAVAKKYWYIVFPVLALIAFGIFSLVKRGKRSPYKRR